MELQFSFSIIISFILSLLVLFKLVSSTWKRANLFTRNKMPPGPWKLPVIGSFHHLIGSLEKPHRGFRELAKKHGDIMHLQLGNMSVVVVSSREMAMQVLKIHDLTFADRPELYVKKLIPGAGRDIIMSRYGEYWRQMRKLCMLELLSTKRVRSFSSIREQEASAVIDSIHLSANSNINLTEMILSYTGNIICRAAFGGKRKDQLAFGLLTNDMFLLAARFSMSDMFPPLAFLYVMGGLKAKLLKIYEEASKILENIISEHIDQKTTSSDQYGEVEPEKEDFVDVLLRLQKSGNLEDHITTNDITAVIWDIFIAASETTSATITWAMAEMMRDPRVMEKAQVEIRETLKGKNQITEIDIQKLSYLKLVIKETLRLHPPIPLLVARECRERCEINGAYEIPLKTVVLVNAWALGRDPRYWNDPDSFIPERFSDGTSTDFKGMNFEFIPFGAGRRICPGMTLGLANMETLLAQLLYYFNWKLPNGIEPETFDMTEIFRSTVRKKDDIFAVATPYIPRKI